MAKALVTFRLGKEEVEGEGEGRMEGGRAGEREGGRIVEEEAATTEVVVEAGERGGGEGGREGRLCLFAPEAPAGGQGKGAVIAGREEGVGAYREEGEEEEVEGGKEYEEEMEDAEQSATMRILPVFGESR